jgi:hypothetical protein
MASRMILLALILFLVSAVRRVVSVGIFTWFVVEFSTMSHNSFSYRIKIILSFQAPKFTAPSSLSSTLKPVAIDPSQLKIKVPKICPVK